MLIRAAFVFWLAALAGCGGGTADPGPPPAAGHDHKDGGHGGTVVAVGRGHYHVEVVFGTGGTFDLFTLGADETRVVDVPDQTPTAYVKSPDRPQADAITLTPRPQPGDAPGRTSRFAGQLPAYCDGREVVLSVPRLTIDGERFRFTVRRAVEPADAMPGKVIDDEERRLYLTPGGKYTAADIRANGRTTASERFKAFKPAHDHKPRPGDPLCPVTLTKASPDCTWIIDGRTYSFCCPPCVDEFVKLAKERPADVKPPGEYVKK